MLILSDADGFRINLHQLCQRILKTSCDRRCAPLSHIKVREFFRRQLAGRIDGCSGFADNDILHFLRDFLQQFHNHLFRLSGCGSISKRNERNMIFADQLFQHFFCFFYFVLRSCRVDDHRIQHLAGRINNCQFAASAECRIPAKNSLPCNRRLHQKLLQVFTKHTDSPFFRILSQCISDLTLNSRSNETAVTVLYHCFQNRRGIRIFLTDHAAFQIT